MVGIAVSREIGDELRQVIHRFVSARGSNGGEDVLRHLQAAGSLLEGPAAPSEYDITTLDGWAAVREWNPFAGLSNPLGARTSVELREHESGVPCGEATVTFGVTHQGAPGCVHGGFLSAYFDDLFGCTQRAYDFTAVTVELTTSFRAAAPLGEPLTFTTWYDGDLSGRKVAGRGTCTTSDGLVAESTALFVKLDLHALRRAKGPSESPQP